MKSLTHNKDTKETPMNEPHVAPITGSVAIPVWMVVLLNNQEVFVAQSNENVYRLSPYIAEILSGIAMAKNLSEAMVLESLVRNEALAMGIIGNDHPEKAFGDLIAVVEGWAIPAHADFTLHVFERIASTPEVLHLYEKAVAPLPEQRADKRKHSVNQRLGRFCKRLIRWQSAEEIQLGKGSVDLIQSYTRLKP